MLPIINSYQLLLINDFLSRWICFEIANLDPRNNEKCNDSCENSIVLPT